MTQTKKAITSAVKQKLTFFNDSATRKKWLPLVITSAIAFIISTILAVMVFRYQINPDGISYIHVAERYAAFDFSNGLNGYWGPLLSWLLVPFIWLGLDPVISLYIVSTLCSIATVFLVHNFALKRLPSLKPLPLYLIEATLLLVLVSFSLSVLTPDILLSFMLFVVFFVFVRFHERPALSTGIALGVAGAFLYFAKPMGLLLFGFTLVVYAIYFLIQKKPGFKYVITALAAFVALSLPYTAALSAKYHQLTFSTSSAYNLSLISPTYKRGHLINQPGIYLPANEQSTSVWDDPSYLPVQHWNPLDSSADVKYYMNQILTNIHSLTRYMNDLGVIFLLGLAAVLFTSLVKKRLQVEALIAACIVLGLVGLYALSVVEPRHTWPLIPLSFIGILFVIDYLSSKSIALKQAVLFISAAVIVLSAPLLTPVNTGEVWPSYMNVAFSIKPYVSPGDRIVSDDAGMMYSCFNLDIQCSGILATDVDDETINYLKDNNVQYLYLNDAKPYKDVLDTYYNQVAPDLNLYILK
jgi:hypothetical protein